LGVFSLALGPWTTSALQAASVAVEGVNILKLTFLRGFASVTFLNLPVAGELAAKAMKLSAAPEIFAIVEGAAAEFEASRAIISSHN
jgi:hypothetical protein